MGVDYTHVHAACCAAQLPAGARVWRGTAAEWSTVDYLVASMEHTLRVIAWQSTEDAQKRRNYPKPIETPAAREERDLHAANALQNRAWIDSVLASTQIGEVNDGRSR